MSASFSGTLFDGETLTAHPVSIQSLGGRLQSLTEEVHLDVAASEVRTSDRLASLPRFLYLPDGRSIETPDNGMIDTLLASQNRGRIVAAVDWLEAKARVAATATLLLVATSITIFVWGLPVLARNAAMAVPHSIERQAGQTALLTISRLLAPTQLKRADRARVETQLNRLLNGRPFSVQPEVVFRSMGGDFPNAFALPGGFIVVSDELVDLANDDELAAVLAHEIGHWQLRHAMQGMLRSSAALLVVSSLTGDLSTLTTFASTIPFTLLQRGHSREFEEEADSYALDLLRKVGIEPVHFARILKKLEHERPSEGQDLTYLSTHPATIDRIRRIDPGVASELIAENGPTSAAKVDNAESGEKVYSLERPGLILPKALHQPSPSYPTVMAAARLNGDVTIEFVINRHGKVVSPQIVHSTHREFEAPAIAAIEKWSFAPGRWRGRNVAVKASQKVEFNFGDEAGAEDTVIEAATSDFQPSDPASRLREPRGSD